MEMGQRSMVAEEVRRVYLGVVGGAEGKVEEGLACAACELEVRCRGGVGLISSGVGLPWVLEVLVW